MTRVVQPFVNHLPVRVEFAENAAASLPDLMREIGATRVALLIDADIEQHNVAVREALDEWATAGLRLTRLAKPAGEPTIEMVDAATAGLREADAEAVVALGGGSVIDTAKAARLCHQLRCSFSDFLDSDRSYPAPDLPLIALPTTAGTGSEVSGGAVVTDQASGRKAGIAHPHLRPQHALVDPRLTWSMPPSMTANTGIDALAQAIAALIAKVHTPVGDAIALEAISMIGRSLTQAFRNGDDHDARSLMSCGSMMAGLAMNISDCTAEHSLGQAIGGLTGAPHGLTVGLVLAETMDRERHHVPAQLERVADALGIPDDGSADGSRAVRAIRNILADLDFPVLAELGVGEEHLHRLTVAASEDYFITMSPSPWEPEEVRTALTSALALTTRQPVDEVAR